jgi:pyridoxamine 5'-phosphate oxidase
VSADEAPGDPFELLTTWLPANSDPVRPLMTLATVSADGRPNARTVLLSEYDPSGFWFHTDARSAKIAEIDATGYAALMIHLPARTAQIVVQGPVVPATPEEQERAYAARSPYLRRLAWLNTAELAARPLAERQAAWADSAAQRPDSGLHPPATWTGRKVVPERIKLWIGREDTASRRFDYTRTPSGWALALLPG